MKEIAPDPALRCCQRNLTGLHSAILLNTDIATLDRPRIKLMSEVNQIIETLKQLLKEKTRTNFDVAASLNLGVARVKQMNANNDWSLSRLAKVCDEQLDMEIADLIQITQDRQKYIQSLTEKQEQQLISDERLLVVSVSIMNNWTPTEIVERYEITDAECNRHLMTLEKLKLISRRANGRIKLLIDRNFQWIPDGPLEQFFRQHVQIDFLDASFSGPGEVRLFRTGMLTSKSAEELTRRIDKVVNEFMELNREDAQLELQHRVGYSFLVAMRPWLMPSFTKLLRRDPG